MDRKTGLARGMIAMIAVIFVLIFAFFPLHEDWIRENNRGRKKLEVSAGENYTWSFPIQDDGVSSLELSFSGMKNARDLTISMSLLDANGQTAASERKKPSEIESEDNAVRLQGQLQRGMFYTLCLTAEGEGMIKLRGSESEESGIFEPMITISGVKDLRNPVLLYFAGGLLMVAVTPVFQSRRPRRLRREKESVAARILPWLTFILIASLGLYITVKRPMFNILEDWHSWDEDTHWELVQQMGLFRAEGIRRLAYDMITWDPGYLPLIIGYNIGQIFTSNEVMLYRAAIAFNSVCYAATCALAVKHAPRYKASFVVAATMPTVVFLMISISYDTVVIGSILLGTALLLETLEREEAVSSMRAMALVAMMAFGTVAKPAYSIILFTLLMIPVRQLGGKRKALLFRLFVVLMTGWCFMAMAMPGAYESVMEGDSRFEGTSVSGQIAYILDNPIEGGLRPVRYVFDNWNALMTWGISHWAYLGNNARANEIYLWLMLIAAPLCASGELWDRKGILNWRKRVSFAAIAMGSEIILSYAQFLASTPVGGWVQGMQARYFIPVWILMLMAVMWPHRIRSRLGKVSEWGSLVVWAFCLIINLQNTMTHMIV